MAKQTGSTSTWSQTYYKGLTANQHQANNQWLIQMTQFLKPGGHIVVPNLGKSFTVSNNTFTEV